MDEDQRLVGADRVLAVLVELAEHPEGVSLDELANRVRSPKPTVHRALGSLRRAGLANQIARGTYVLGDEFIRLAFQNHAARPDGARLEPILRELAHRYGETAHYAVLDGANIVYRAKVDPPSGGVRLTSEIGGRNPAYRTAIGKLLLSYHVPDAEALVELVGKGPLEARTPNTITSVSALWEELRRTRERGYGVDDQENEVGVNCVAVPVGLRVSGRPVGGVSVSSLTFRFPLDRLVAEVPSIREAVGAA